MGKKDPRVDAYIAESAAFARPILKHLRRLVHAACPGVEETIKWRFPVFVRDGTLCSMGAFKQHCSFGFWHRAMIDSLAKINASDDDAMGQFGRITSIADLPSEAVLKRLVAEAARLNESGVKGPREKVSKPKQKLTMPADLRAALKKNKRAGATFENFSYTNKKDYLEWIAEAKRPETRAKRLATTLEWLAEGKTRNWKYQ